MKKIILTCLMALSLNVFAEGNSLKDVQFKDLNNQPTTLAQQISSGKKIYVKAWASWCPICLAGLEEINTLSADKNKGFEIVTIVSPSHKGEKNTQDFIEWYKGLDYKNIVVLLDEQGETLKRAEIRGYPSSIVLDENLMIQKTVPGHLNAQEIQALMQKGK